MTLVNIRILRHVKSKSLSFISMRTIKKKSTIKLFPNSDEAAIYKCFQN